MSSPLLLPREKWADGRDPGLPWEKRRASVEEVSRSRDVASVDAKRVVPDSRRRRHGDGAFSVTGPTTARVESAYPTSIRAQTNVSNNAAAQHLPPAVLHYGGRARHAGRIGK